jgi:hypothetical protein
MRPAGPRNGPLRGLKGRWWKKLQVTPLCGVAPAPARRMRLAKFVHFQRGHGPLWTPQISTFTESHRPDQKRKTAS